MKHIMRGLFIAGAALFLGGCIKVKQIVIVNPDGSGNVVVSQALGAEAVAMMTQMAAGFASQLGGDAKEAPKQPENPLYDLEKLREAAADLGEGVTFVKASEINTNGTKGAIAVYSFTDVTKLHLKTKQEGPGMGAGFGAAEPPKAGKEESISFGFTKGDTSKLVIHMPDMKPKTGTAAGGAAKPATTGDAKGGDAVPPELAALGLGGGKDANAGMAMMQMFKGMEIQFAVQVKGEVVKHDASNQDKANPTRFVLMHMNMDELMKTPDFQKMLASGDQAGGDEDEQMKKFFSLPGAQLETKPEVTIEFK